MRAAAEQIVGRERRERVSQLESSGDAGLNSRRRVNSDVRCFFLIIRAGLAGDNHLNEKIK
jgi:hypothetical protein